tara:strand:+ start:43 stop:459 length:417 start_codon:yes stop_codon:yes gene_type:complete
MKPKICIVVSEFNKKITTKIQNDAVHKLLDMGVPRKNIKVIHVKGSFEIPYAISKLIKRYAGFIAAGCIIKGETPNFDFISQAITNGIMQLSITHYKPIGNAIITSYNEKQANIRSSIKGKEAAIAVLDALNKLENSK